MAILKCKMCGGDIEINANKTFATCEYCGNTTTLPKIDDDQRAAAFNRGNHFRRIGEFDKALTVYERIVQEDNSDAEAHWCCALCRFGIEYVEDPTTYEWLPTCHRASFDSFLEDVDYKAALEYSEGMTLRQYMKDGAKIAEVQKGILSTSQNAEPYDIFICYKESDEQGERTRDSLMAQEIYYQLVEQGRKVFFARITLENIVGTQYEPYIFAALNSAKVMIVVGTKPEYLSAVWVKNEWSRFLSMMKKDRQKLLLPCYKDMDPYDLPEQLAVLQSYDMSKIGFIQDLTRGISKVLDNDKKTEKLSESISVQPSTETNITPLLKRVFMFLEDEDWKAADEYCEKVLDVDPECAQAYLGKLMVKLKVKKVERLVDCEETFTEETFYKKIIRFADEELKNQLETYNAEIRERKNFIRCQKIYQSAKNKMDCAKKSQQFLDAAMEFEKVLGFLDSDTLKTECCTKAEEYLEKEKVAEKEAIYKRACDLLSESYIYSIRSAIGMFKKIEDWRDSSAKIQEGLNRINELKEAEANERKETIYKRACKNLENGGEQALDSAIRDFELIPEWKDSKEKLCVCQKTIEEIQLRKEAERLEKERQVEVERIERERQAERARIESAARAKKHAIIVAIVITLIIAIGTLYTTVIRPLNAYNEALEMLKIKEYDAAIEAFDKMPGYKDSDELLKQSKYEKAGVQYAQGDYNKAITLYEELGDYKDSVEFIKKVKLDNADTIFAEKDWNKALNIYRELMKDSNYKESVKQSVYEKAIGLFEGNEIVYSLEYFESLGDYKDSLTNKAYLVARQAEMQSVEKALELYKELPLDFKDVNEKVEVLTKMSKYCGSYIHKRNENSAFDRYKGEKITLALCLEMYLMEDGNYGVYVLPYEKDYFGKGTVLAENGDGYAYRDISGFLEYGIDNGVKLEYKDSDRYSFEFPFSGYIDEKGILENGTLKMIAKRGREKPAETFEFTKK